MHRIKTVKDDFLREQYDLVTHESGLTIYVFPKDMQTTYASLTVRFGSLDCCFRFEDEEEALALPDGIAHFLEHKMFECEDGSDAFEHFSKIGADANAYTTNEETSYLFSTPGDVETALKILIDLVFTPCFNEKNVQKEMGIIGQEIKMYEDSVNSRLYESILELLYVNHSIRAKIAGTEETISAITPQLLMRCHRAFYRPRNMILTVVGKVTTEKILETVDEVLPTLPAAVPIAGVQEEPPTIFCKSREFQMAIAKPKLCVGIKDIAVPRDPLEKTKRAVAMNILADLAFGSGTALYDRLYREGLISGDFSVCYEVIRDCGHFLVTASTDDPERLLHELRAEWNRWQTAPEFEVEDFRRIRKVHYAEFVKDFDSTEEIAMALLDAAVDGNDLFDIGNVIKSITLDEIEAYAKSFFDEERLAYTVISPTKGAE